MALFILPLISVLTGGDKKKPGDKNVFNEVANFVNGWVKAIEEIPKIMISIDDLILALARTLTAGAVFAEDLIEGSGPVFIRQVNVLLKLAPLVVAYSVAARIVPELQLPKSDT